MINLFSAIIVCAGKSTRMNHKGNKTLLPFFGRPMFLKSVDLFLKYTDDVIVVINEDDFETFKNYYDNVILGGKTRQDSVYQGALKAKYNQLFIHDGARPNLSEADLEQLIIASKTNDTLFLGSKLFDSIKDLEYNNLDRNKYFLAYTPQVVLKEDFISAYQEATLKNLQFSDDVSLVKEILNKDIKMVLGSKDNIKVTTNEDYDNLLNQDYRIGHSFDVHKLVTGRPLILGGIHIPYEKGLLGHSDADCLLHAISEAFLGSLALGDLGHFYPDNSEKTLGMDSKIILKECYQRVLDLGYELVNVDAMIYLEQPKLAPYMLELRKSIAQILNCDINNVSLKATTAEKLGVVGEGKAIASEATLLIRKKRVE